MVKKSNYVTQIKRNIPPGAGTEIHRWCGRYLEDFGLPPFAIHEGFWRYGKCVRCQKIPLYSFGACADHMTITKPLFRKIYARFAKTVVECAGVKLDKMLEDLESGFYGGTMAFVRYNPRVVDLRSRVSDALWHAGRIDLPLFERRKHDPKTKELQESLMAKSSETLDWYIERMDKYPADFEKIFDLFEELVFWACQYVIAYE